MASGLDDLLDSALDGFESDDDEEEEVGEVQLSPTEAHEDAVAPMTPPRPGTEPLPDATSPLIGQMLDNLQELQNTTGVSAEEVGLLRSLIENLPSTATTAASPPPSAGKKSDADAVPKTPAVAAETSPKPKPTAAVLVADKPDAGGSAAASQTVTSGPTMADASAAPEPWPACAAAAPVSELSFLGAPLGSKALPAPPKPATPTTAAGPSFEDIMANAAQQMSENTEGVAAGMEGGDMEGLGEEEMAKMQEMMAKLAAGLDGDGDGGGEEGLGIMEQMMEHLLAKDVLYPSLLEIAQKYPDYLAETGPTLSKEDLQKYTEQEKVIKEICATYEDASLTSQKQVSKVMELMEKMQAYGAPPQEIIKALDVEVGPDGMPSLGGLLGGAGGIPGMPGGDKCTIC